ncbi:MAG: hypothetical protein WKF37_01545 [Bryobacteraceae bacterium]
MKRFAGMYTGEDPEAPNYDPENRVIRSIWTGSKGPMLHDATTYDWVGVPVPGSFHLLHNRASRNKLLDLNAHYPKMLAHCKYYLDSVGDHPLNLASTNLGLNAFALTNQAKYKDWVVDYAGAWKKRTEECGGNIPTNVGRDGKPGGEYGGQWWKGTYGWNFTIFDGELEEIAHRNTFTAGSWPGFANALMLTGDQSFIGVLRRQMDNIYAQKKVQGGKVLLPQMYGDPKGYKEKGSPGWYHYRQPFHGPFDRDLHVVHESQGSGAHSDRRLYRVPARKSSRVPGAGASIRPGIRPGQFSRDGCGFDNSGYSPGRLPDGVQSGCDPCADEPNHGRLSGGQHLDVAQPFSVF